MSFHYTRGTLFRASAFFILFIHIVFVSAQSENNSRPILQGGIELQAYPTGFIPGIRFELGLSSKNSFSLRVGYQYIRHGDAGKHEDERGDGIGFTIGYRRYFNPKSMQGYFLGLRNDVWFNSILWKDDIGTLSESHGNTHIVVLQPTLETGYVFALADHRIFISPTLAFGMEINIHTVGAPVGEGLIVLGGLNVAYRFAANP